MNQIAPTDKLEDSPKGSLVAVGLMSGTSMDGIDVALIETDGESVRHLGPAGGYPYSEGHRAILRRALAEARSLGDRQVRPGILAEAEALVTRLHAEAVIDFLNANGLDPAAIDLVGFHGQTVLHRPDARLTVQLGDGAALARAVGIPVVGDFRAADVAAGGQGAPFAPAYHRALAVGSGTFPQIVVNIGGVANVTWLGNAGDPVAFDTGPGNALLDDFIAARTGTPFDEGGRVALAGRVDEATLAALLDDPYFWRKPPKSLDRDAFSAAPVASLATADGAATLVAFTAATIAGALDQVPEPPARIVATGGGRHNRAIMAALQARVDVPVVTAEVAGWRGDSIEAEAFAFLAVRSVKGLALSWPSTTGVPAPQTGGVVWRP